MERRRLAPRARSVKEEASWKLRCSWLIRTSKVTGLAPGRGFLMDSENCDRASIRVVVESAMPSRCD